MSKRPNLLILWTDEQRPDTMACYGNHYVQAPNLNRFAERSFVFENAYCVQPVCTPSRGTIMTGLWPHQHGARGNNTPLRSDARTIAERVSDDYRCAYLGKWHLGDEITAQRGFDTWVSMEDAGYRKYYSNPEDLKRRSDYHHFLTANGFTPDTSTPDGTKLFGRGFAAAMAPWFTKPHFLGQQASQLIRKHDQNQPLLMSVNFLEPHMPFFGPYNNRHDPDQVPVGPAFNRRPPANASLRNRMFADMYARKTIGDSTMDNNEAAWRRLRANYLGLVTLVDDAVGMILKALEDSGMADNTIVVFTSDHGEMMGDYGMQGKCVAYEPSVKVPWLIHVPWLSRQQQMIPGRASHIDLVPTLLDLLDQPLDEDLPGVSRADVLRGDATLDGQDAFFIWDGHAPQMLKNGMPGYTDEQVENVRTQQWRSVVTSDGWKLNLCPTDQCELYDLNNDCHEQHNLFDAPDQQARVRDMAQRIRRWQQQVDDNCPLPSV